jgi:hypothetical protein
MTSAPLMQLLLVQFWTMAQAEACMYRCAVLQVTGCNHCGRYAASPAQGAAC